MGIYDREYIRDGPSYLGSWAHSGLVCKWLVGVNVVVFLIQLVSAQWGKGDLGPVTEWLAMKPVETFEQFQLWRLVTGAFLHNPHSPWHIIWNMLFLWFFGRDVEDRYGHREFLAFYLLAGMVGNLLWGLTATWGYPADQAPEIARHMMAIGASGAVTGVLVLCAFLHPHKTILLMFVIPVPYWLFAIIHVAGDLFGFLRGGNTGIAVAAHLGGAAFAAAYYWFDWRLTGFASDFLRRASRSRRPRLRVYAEEEPNAVAARPSRSRLDEQLEAKTDEVLEKVARNGLDSLSPEEREILQKASEQYRKRRS